MTFTIKPRRSLVVYVNNLRSVRQLRHYGRVEYVSKKMRYVILYTDEETVEQTLKKENELKFVKHVSYSHWPEIDPDMSDLKAAGIYKHETEEDE